MPKEERNWSSRDTTNVDTNKVFGLNWRPTMISKAVAELGHQFKITKVLDHVNQCINLFHKIAGEASIYKPLDQNLFNPPFGNITGEWKAKPIPTARCTYN
ncbi:hypothetical protein TNCV_1920521 [Trichonephila clavipes]|nr:hypothetical protein TNCV_1920521 [Trichonephila clavipes]